METVANTIYEGWVRAWNGDLSAVDEIIAEAFVFHREHGQPEIKGREALEKLIRQSRAAFSQLSFKTSIGPIHDGEWLTGRNEAVGVYAGGLPGATAPAGTQVLLTGIDILRLKDGKIVECWHNGNDLAFMLQLGAVQMNGV